VDQRLRYAPRQGASLFYVARALQALGFADVGLGLYLGLTLDRGGLRAELALALAGVALFYAGRYLEKRAATT